MHLCQMDESIYLDAKRVSRRVQNFIPQLHDMHAFLMQNVAILLPSSIHKHWNPTCVIQVLCLEYYTWSIIPEVYVLSK